MRAAGQKVRWIETGQMCEAKQEFTWIRCRTFIRVRVELWKHSKAKQSLWHRRTQKRRLIYATTDRHMMCRVRQCLDSDADSVHYNDLRRAPIGFHGFNALRDGLTFRIKILTASYLTHEGWRTKEDCLLICTSTSSTCVSVGIQWLWAYTINQAANNIHRDRKTERRMDKRVFHARQYVRQFGELSQGIRHTVICKKWCVYGILPNLRRVIPRN